MRNTKSHKSKTIYYICFLLMMIILCGAQAQKEMKEGNRLLKKGNYHKALLAYKKSEGKIAEQESSIQADFFSKIGECYLKLGYYSLAYSYFKEATKYDSTYVNTLDSYIETLKNNGEYSKALDLYYQKLLADSPSLSDSANGKNDLAYYSFPYQNKGENKLFTIVPQNNINTLGRKRGLSIIGNRLYYSTTGYSIIPDQKDYTEKTTKYTLFSADIVENSIANSIVENELLDIESNITYICTHPITKNLFFTVITSDNEEYLYEATAEEDGKWKNASKVKIGKKTIPISHPIFNNDGTVMIFSANLPDGMGGHDIWYTKQTEKGWSDPTNLGNTINTKGDEICPFLYNNSLFFSSNGQAESYGGFDIYCANSTTNNNIEVENILLPYNSYADDIEFTIDAQHSKGFLVSTRDYTSTDDKIYSFSEVPYYTIVKGNVSDYYNNTLPEATITVIENNTPIYTAKTDKVGNYQVYLKNNHKYTLEISKANYLSTKDYYTTQSNKPVGNTEIKANTKLDGFELNKAYKIENIFFHTASYEFATIGKTLPKIETFMKENPHLDLYFYLFGYLTPDDKFNDLLNQRRINSITNYFIEQSVNENRIKHRKYSNEIPTNFGKVDLKKDTSYLLYFLFVPKDTDAIKANTTSR